MTVRYNYQLFLSALPLPEQTESTYVLLYFSYRFNVKTNKVPDLPQLVPLCGCNQDHLGNLTRLTSGGDAVSCICQSQKICGTTETGPSEMYKAPNYNYNKIMHSDDCQALSNANLHFLFMKCGLARVFCDIYGQRLEALSCVPRVPGICVCLMCPIFFSTK